MAFPRGHGRFALDDTIAPRAAALVAAAGGAVGALSVVPVAALVTLQAAAGAGGRLQALGLAAAAGLAALLAAGIVVAATAARLSAAPLALPRGAAWRTALMAWWPAIALAPIPVSAVLGGDAAHRFLHAPNEGRIYVLYLAFWVLALHVGLYLRARLDGRPAPGAGGVSATAGPIALAPRPLLIACGAALTLVCFLNWGLIQQLTARQGEFESHFVAARVMMRGVQPYRLDLDPWAQVNVPPVTLLLVYAPWIKLPDLPRHLLYGALHLTAFATACTLLLRRFVSPRIPAYAAAMAIILLGSIYAPWRESFWLGQPNGFIFFLLTVSLLLILRQRWVLAALLAALTLVFKPVAGWVLLYMLVARRLRAVVLAGVAAAALCALSLPFTGLEVWRIWITEKAPLLLQGTTHHTSISLPVLHARLFLTSNAYYLAVPPPTSQLVTILNGIAALTSLLLLAALVRPSRDRSDWRGRALEFSLATVLALLLSPLTWLHYATAALIAFAAVTGVCWDGAIPAGLKRAAAALAILAFGVLSIDQELLLLRTAVMWERWPLIGSISNTGLPLLAAAVAVLLWAHNRVVATPSAGPDGRAVVDRSNGMPDAEHVSRRPVVALPPAPEPAPALP